MELSLVTICVLVCYINLNMGCPEENQGVDPNDTGKTNDDVLLELTKCYAITAPELHAVLLVLDIGRVTIESLKTVDLILSHFGESVINYLIVVFTGKDVLNALDMSIDDYVETLKYESSLTNLIGLGKDKDEDVKQLLTMVDQMFENNKGRFYHNEIYLAAEKLMMQRLLDEKNRHAAEPDDISKRRELEINRIKEKYDELINTPREEPPKAKEKVLSDIKNEFDKILARQKLEREESAHSETKKESSETKNQTEKKIRDSFRQKAVEGERMKEKYDEHINTPREEPPKAKEKVLSDIQNELDKIRARQKLEREESAHNETKKESSETKNQTEKQVRDSFRQKAVEGERMKEKYDEHINTPREEPPKAKEKVLSDIQNELDKIRARQKLEREESAHNETKKESSETKNQTEKQMRDSFRQKAVEGDRMKEKYDEHMNTPREEPPKAKEKVLSDIQNELDKIRARQKLEREESAHNETKKESSETKNQTEKQMRDSFRQKAVEGDRMKEKYDEHINTPREEPPKAKEKVLSDIQNELDKIRARQKLEREESAHNETKKESSETKNQTEKQVRDSFRQKAVEGERMKEKYDEHINTPREEPPKAKEKVLSDIQNELDKIRARQKLEREESAHNETKKESSETKNQTEKQMRDSFRQKAVEGDRMKEKYDEHMNTPREEPPKAKEKVLSDIQNELDKIRARQKLEREESAHNETKKESSETKNQTEKQMRDSFRQKAVEGDRMKEKYDEHINTPREEPPKAKEKVLSDIQNELDKIRARQKLELEESAHNETKKESSETKNQTEKQMRDSFRQKAVEGDRMKEKYDEHINTPREEPPKAKEKVLSDIQNELDKIRARQKLEREESAHNETKKESSETKNQTEKQMRDSFRQKAVEGDRMKEKYDKHINTPREEPPKAKEKVLSDIQNELDKIRARQKLEREESAHNETKKESSETKNQTEKQMRDSFRQKAVEGDRMKEKYDEHINTQREEPPKAKEKVLSDIQNELDKIRARQKLEREESAHNETKKESSETKNQTEKQMRDSFRQKAVEGDRMKEKYDEHINTPREEPPKAKEKVLSYIQNELDKIRARQKLEREESAHNETKKESSETKNQTEKQMRDSFRQKAVEGDRMKEKYDEHINTPRVEPPKAKEKVLSDIQNELDKIRARQKLEREESAHNETKKESSETKNQTEKQMRDSFRQKAVEGDRVKEKYDEHINTPREEPPKAKEKVLSDIQNELDKIRARQKLEREESAHKETKKESSETKNQTEKQMRDSFRQKAVEGDKMKEKYDEHINTPREEPPMAKEKVLSDIQNKLDKIRARQKFEREISAHNETKKESSETKNQTEKQMRDSFRQKAVEGDNALLESFFNFVQSFVGFVISYVSPWHNVYTKADLKISLEVLKSQVVVRFTSNSIRRLIELNIFSLLIEVINWIDFIFNIFLPYAR